MNCLIAHIILSLLSFFLVAMLIKGIHQRDDLYLENSKMRKSLSYIASWSDEMCGWKDAGVRARGMAKSSLKSLDEKN